jgi:hypothetical protein
MVWTFWRREKSLASTGIPTMDRRSHSAVAKPTTPKRLLFRDVKTRQIVTSSTSLPTERVVEKINKSKYTSNRFLIVFS